MRIACRTPQAALRGVTRRRKRGLNVMLDGVMTINQVSIVVVTVLTRLSIWPLV